MDTKRFRYEPPLVRDITGLSTIGQGTEGFCSVGDMPSVSGECTAGPGVGGCVTGNNNTPGSCKDGLAANACNNGSGDGSQSYCSTGIIADL